MKTLRSARHFLARLRRLPQQRAALRDGTGIRIQQTMRYAEAWRAQTDWETPLEFFRRPDFTQLGLPARIAPLGETDAAAFLWSTTLEYCDQFVLQRRNCGFTPWGLTFIDRDGTLVEELNVWFPMGSDSPELADFYAQQVFIGKPLPGRSLFLTAPAAQNYSHWLLDVVPSFHLLELTGVEAASFDRVISNRVDLAFHSGRNGASARRSCMRSVI